MEMQGSKLWIWETRPQVASEELMFPSPFELNGTGNTTFEAVCDLNVQLVECGLAPYRTEGYDRHEQIPSTRIIVATHCFSDEELNWMAVRHTM